MALLRGSLLRPRRFARFGTIRYEDFVQEKDSCRWVSTSSLPQYMHEWRSAKEQVTKEESEAQNSAVRRILYESANYVSRLSFMSTRRGFPFQVDESIMLSILVLGCTLDYTRKNIYADVAEQPDSILLLSKSSLLRDRLLAQGCCPNQVAMLQQTLSPATMYYAYRTDALEHRKDHSRCSEQQCLVDNVDERTYITQHQKDFCDGTCESVAFPMVKARAIIDGGGYPIISVAPPVQPLDEPDVEVVEALPEIPYLAISHVWADGLGNPHHNSLPRCQMIYLRAKVRDCMYDTTGKGAHLHNGRLHFWIDTVCVPLQQPHRGKAIKLMAQTYTAATRVLVLDRQVRDLTWTEPFSEKRYEEHMIKITCCAWLRRLWTFQEGVLAKRLYFQCADGACEVGVWVLQHVRDPARALWHIVGAEVVNFHLLMRRLRRTDGAERVAHVWAALQWRATSRRADELICVAAPPDRRMDAFLDLQQLFPPGIVFASGPRLDRPGRRWAPASFMASQPYDYAVMDSESMPAYFDQRGLYVTYPGMRLTVPHSPVVAQCLMLVDEAERSCFQLQRVDVDGDSASPDRQIDTKRVLMLVLHRLPDGTQTEIRGILVEGQDTGDGECLHVEYWCNVSLVQEPEESWEHNFSMFSEECNKEFDEYLFARCPMLDFQQQWCIG